MHESGLFSKTEMKEWDRRDDDEQDWDGAVEFFENLVDEDEAYEMNNGSTAKKARYESAANVEEEDAGDELRRYFNEVESAKERENATKEQLAQVMSSNESLLAMIKAKDNQIATLVEQVKELNASVIELTKEVSKAARAKSNNTTSNNGNNNRNRNRNNNNKRRDGGSGCDNKRLCKHCGGTHRDEYCWELEKNAHQRPDDWTTVKKE